MKIPKGYGRFNEEEIEDIEQSDEEYYNSQNASFGNFLKIIFSKIATLCSKVGNALKYRLNKTANYIRAHLILIVAVVVIIGVILPIVVFTVKWDKTIDGVTYSLSTWEQWNNGSLQLKILIYGALRKLFVQTELLNYSSLIKRLNLKVCDERAY